jgi:hypothetical protein
MQRPLPYISVSKDIRDVLSRMLLLRKTEKVQYISRKLELFDRIETLPPEIKASLRPSVATYFDGYDALYDENDCPTLFYLMIQLFLMFLLVSFLIPLLFGSLGSLFFAQAPRGTLHPTLLSFIPCILLAIPGVFGETLIERRIENKYAEAYIISCLIRILAYEETHPYDWARIQHKRYLLFTIDRLAFHIENILPRRLCSGDGATNAWLKTTMKQIAAALRDKKKWILTPQEHTRDNFLNEMAYMLIFFVQGNWDALDRKELEGMTTRGIWHTFVDLLLKMVKFLLSAIFPLALFFALQQTPFAFTGALYNGAIFFLILYEFVILASALNPDFGARISTIKDIISIGK